MSMYHADADLCPWCGTTVSYDYTLETLASPPTAYFSCDRGGCEYWRAVEGPVG